MLSLWCALLLINNAAFVSVCCPPEGVHPRFKMDNIISHSVATEHWIRWIIVLGAPILCVVLVVAKLALGLGIPWLVVLMPIWLPVLIFLAMLIGAMWLDRLHERISGD